MPRLMHFACRVPDGSISIRLKLTQHESSLEYASIKCMQGNAALRLRYKAATFRLVRSNFRKLLHAYCGTAKYSRTQYFAVPKPSSLNGVRGVTITMP